MTARARHISQARRIPLRLSAAERRRIQRIVARALAGKLSFKAGLALAEGGK